MTKENFILDFNKQFPTEKEKKEEIEYMKQRKETQSDFIKKITEQFIIWAEETLINE